MGAKPDPRFTESDAEIIQRKAERLVGHYGYRPSDVEDIQQDLAMHVFPRTHLHRPERGSREAFVSQIVKNRILHLIEARTALKRDNRHNVSIDKAGEGTLLDGTNTAEQVDVVIDVREAIERLPEELKQVAILRQQYSESELEGLLGLTRGQVRSRIQRLQRIFRDAHLAPDF